jgi:hypothetical protein
MWLILSEIQVLRRVDFTPNSFMEVVVRDLSIPIVVELCEDTLKLLVCEDETPMFEVKPQLVGLDIA